MLDIRDHGGQYGGGEKERWIYDIPNLNVMPYTNGFITPDTLIASGKLRDVSLVNGYGEIPVAYKGQYFGVFTDQNNYKFVGRYTKAMERIQLEYSYNVSDLFDRGLKVFKSLNKAVLVGINSGSLYFRAYNIAQDGAFTSTGSRTVFSAGSSSSFRFVTDETRDRMYFYDVANKRLYVYKISDASSSSVALAAHLISDYPYSIAEMNILDSGDVLLSGSTRTYRYTAINALISHGYVTTSEVSTLIHEDSTHVYFVHQGTAIHKMDKSLNTIASIPLSGVSGLKVLNSFTGKGVLMTRYNEPTVLFKLNTKTFSLEFFIVPSVHENVMSSNSLNVYRPETNSVSFIRDDERNKLVYVGNFRSVFNTSTAVYYKAIEYNLKV